jgi:hypothetical protein
MTLGHEKLDGHPEFDPDPDSDFDPDEIKANQISPGDG